MKPGLSFAIAGCLAGSLITGAHAAAPVPASVPSAPVTATPAPAPASSVTSAPPNTATVATAPAVAPGGPVTPVATAQPATPAPALPATGMPATSTHQASEAPSATGSLLQTVFGLAVVLALLVGLAWFLKRYGPKNMGGNANLRVVGSLSLGGRERIVVVEVADQWIVVGASPGRVNGLATLPRQESLPPGLLSPQNGLAATNFSEWLKQTIDKRNGK